MKTLLNPILQRLNAGETLSLVSIVATQGSAPRAAGAAMVVSGQDTRGSIGGGRLEFLAIAAARRLLAGAEAQQLQQLLRIPLAASTGQCCGGVVHLLIERLTPDCRCWIEEALALSQKKCAWLRLVDRRLPCSRARILSMPLLGDVPLNVASAAQQLLTRAAVDVAVLPHYFIFAQPQLLSVVLFGAGHVGHALAAALAPLPVQLSWLDERSEQFEALAAMPQPANTTMICVDDVIDEIAAMEAGAIWLIMTHSHALDFDILCAILARRDARFVGLIGSAAKRINFLRRLAARGFDAEQCQSVTCPIGLPEIIGKEPEIIALSVAAQLMTLRGPSTALPSTAPSTAAASTELKSTELKAAEPKSITLINEEVV